MVIGRSATYQIEFELGFSPKTARASSHPRLRKRKVRRRAAFLIVMPMWLWARRTIGWSPNWVQGKMGKNGT